MTKPSFETFSDWAKTNLAFDIGERTLRAWAETNLMSLRNAMDTHPSVYGIQEFISANRASNKHKNLNIVTSSLDFQTKRYDSIVSKIYRMNILFNKNFPLPPKYGWVNPRNCFERIKDLVRSTIICRHIDEPEKIASALRELAQASGLKVNVYPHAKEEGYYAFHVYIYFDVVLLDQQWKEFKTTSSLEIQITTEMQYMLYALTHVFYEKERHYLKSNMGDWKWQYKSSRFSASYISHSLHLLEGLILRLYEDLGAKEQAGHVAAFPDESKEEL